MRTSEAIAEKGKSSPKLIVLRGLPASGKTTLAREMLGHDSGAIRVNKDLIRDMLFFGYDPETEPYVKWIETEVARLMLEEGFSVVVDDTNLKDIDIATWQTFAERHRFSPPKIVNIKTPVALCIKRDAKRESPVGAERIREMATDTSMEAQDDAV